MPGATVVLVERNTGSLLSGGTNCKEIATAVCDADGHCSFDSEKLKLGKTRSYFLGIKEAYGAQGSYPCAGKTSGFIELGGTQKQILNADLFKGTFVVQYNNVLNPSQPGDSIIVSLSTIEYPNPRGGVVSGGGGVYGNWINYEIENPPAYPAAFQSEPKTTKAQRLFKYVRKHKLGVITEQMDTIKIRPNQTTTVTIDW